MFTGLVEEIGKIKSVRPFGSGIRLEISAKLICDELKPDDSVSIDGACQTVTKIDPSGFSVDTVRETLSKTTLGSLKAGTEVNLERALRLGDRLGGHLVQGHVDCVGKVVSIGGDAGNKLLWVEFPEKFAKLIVDTGSITISGVSLTSAKCEGNRFLVTIIPHTWNNTTLRGLRNGSGVNLEFDILGKYVDKLLSVGKTESSKPSFLDQFIDQPDY